MPHSALMAEIRRLFRKGVGCAQIAALLRVSYRQINEAVRG